MRGTLLVREHTNVSDDRVVRFVKMSDGSDVNKPALRSRRERDDKPRNALLGTDASCQPPCKSTVWGKTGVRCSKI